MLFAVAPAGTEDQYQPFTLTEDVLKPFESLIPGAGRKMKLPFEPMYFLPGTLLSVVNSPEQLVRSFPWS